MPASSARRIELNRATFDALDLAMADGLFDFAREVVFSADVPDRPPLTKGLVEGGGVLAYVATKKVNQATTGAPTVPKKPRGSERLRVGIISAYGGYGFPGRFLEEGTVNMAAEPFLTPSLLRNLDDATGYIQASVARSGAIKKGST